MSEDSALKNATARRDILVGQISELEQQLKEKRLDLLKAERFIEAWHDFAGVAQPVQFGTPDVTTTKPNPKKEEVAEMAAEVIRERGNPVLRKDLWKILQDRGLSLAGIDPEKVLSTMLWRMPSKIVHLPKWGYWLANAPYSPARYVPGQTSMENKEIEDVFS